MKMGQIVLEMKGIKKSFSGVYALSGIDFSLEQGEVHALLGENGAGKSTLIKIIAGAIEPDEGAKISFDDKTYSSMTPALSAENGVAVIYQDINLVTPMTVAENIATNKMLAEKNDIKCIIYSFISYVLKNRTIKPFKYMNIKFLFELWVKYNNDKQKNINYLRK